MLKKLINLRENESDLHTNTEALSIILEEGKEELTKVPKKEKEEAYSENTRKLLQQRKNALLKQNIPAYKILDKTFRKSKDKKTIAKTNNTTKKHIQNNTRTKTNVTMHEKCITQKKN